MADILIRGMEMPANCCDCALTYYVPGEGSSCIFTDVPCLNIGRQNKCPLVPLPAGHGRIVDAAEILEKANNSPWFDGDVAELGLLLGSEVTTIAPAEGGGEDG